MQVRQNSAHSWLNSDPEKTQKISEFVLLSVSHIGTEVFIAWQMIFVTARLHLLKKQSSGTSGVGADARVIPAPPERSSLG